MDDVLFYAETYVGRAELDKALDQADDFVSVFALVEKANRIKDIRVDEIARGVYKAIEKAFKKR